MAQKKRKSIIFLVGPTAVGKTELAVRLARKIRAEIISCDSMQVYKGMDIGTQKPSHALQKKVKHYMIDILSPDKEFSVADFRRRALRLIKKIHAKGKIPLFVGGTGLYMKGLIDGLFPAPAKDLKLRKKLYKQKRLYERLQRIDPRTAQRIHPNDKKKIVRALEVYYSTKRPMSELKARTRPLADRFDIVIFGLNRDREKLYARINERVDRMFEQGFLDEVRRLRAKKLSLTARQAIGYKEAMEYLKGRGKGRVMVGNTDMEGTGELKDLIKKNTRRYAKRQLTWFGADRRVIWLDLNRLGTDAALKEMTKRKGRISKVRH